MAPPKKSLPYKPPAGFKKVERPRMAGFWKPTKPGQSVSGIVGMRIATNYKGKPGAFYTLKLADDTSGPIETSEGKAVEADGGMIVGVGGAVACSLLEDREGKAVHLFYLGVEEHPKKGQNAAKLYDCYEEDVSE